MLKFIGSFALSVAEYFLDAYVLTVLWSWFIVTTFHLPELTLYAAMGMALVVSYLTKQPDYVAAEQEDFMLKSHVEGIFKPLLALLAGWSIKACM